MSLTDRQKSGVQRLYIMDRWEFKLEHEFVSHCVRLLNGVTEDDKSDVRNYCFILAKDPAVMKQMAQVNAERAAKIAAAKKTKKIIFLVIAAVVVLIGAVAFLVLSSQ